MTRLLDKLIAGAGDRPYTKGKTLTGALRILGLMCEDNYINSGLYKLSIDQKLYQRDADLYLVLEQIDEVDHSNIPGYQA